MKTKGCSPYKLSTRSARLVSPYVLVNLVERSFIAFPVLSPQLRENYRIDQVGEELLKTALANGSA